MLVIVLLCEFDLTVFSGLGLVPVITGATSLPYPAGSLLLGESVLSGPLPRGCEPSGLNFSESPMIAARIAGDPDDALTK